MISNSNYARAFLVFLMLFAVNLSYSQQTETKPAASWQKTSGTSRTKEILSRIAGDKHQNGGFVLLTPDDLSNLSADERKALLAAQGPCDTATAISFGQTINGSLDNTDCRLDDGSYADFYAFNGTAGQQVTISLSSNAFDTYLGLANEDGTFTVEDDDGGGGTNSKIIATLPSTGLYIILANSLDADQFGSYTLVLSSGNTPPTFCSYSFNPPSATVPAAGGIFNFPINTQSGCPWTAVSNSPFITTNSSGTGSGTFSITVAPNNSPTNRTGTVTVGGQTFTVTQIMVICTYTIKPTSVYVPATRSSGSIAVTTQPGCDLAASPSESWVTLTNVSVNSNGIGTVNYTVAANPTILSRGASISVRGVTFIINQTAPRKILFDFDGDGRTNISIYRPSTGFWYILNSNASYSTTQLGNSTDKTVPADYDGDGKTDIAVYRPDTGIWYLQQSVSGFKAIQLGNLEDIPQPADFDGDGKVDLAVFRPSTGTWYVLNRETNQYKTIQFGASGDKPVVADYDGDGRADYAVYRPETGIWYVMESTNGFYAVQFGNSTDKPVVGDYDGDGKSDVAVYRPENGVWYLMQSRDGIKYVQFGLSTDLPAQADYDGDGKTDISVFRPSENVWYQQKSREGFNTIQFGANGDKPVPNSFVP